jgi:HTH-type transcriptional regulator/antitoxin HigA
MIRDIQNQYFPDFVSPPGETLQETLEALGMSQAELAERTGRPKKTINEIIKGKTSISPDTALQLERALGIPAAFWNNRERQYREAIARLTEQERLQEQVAWLKKLPINFMAKLGWIKRVKNEVQQLLEVLNFFGVASPHELQSFWDRREVNFRMSPSLKTDRWIALAWLRKGEIEANKIRCSPFDQKTFRNALAHIRSLTIEEPEVFQPKMVDLCAMSGVALIFIAEIPRVRVSGAARWLASSKAMIQLNLRYKTEDHLWFTFFHDAGHILRHDKRLTFIEQLHERKSSREQGQNSMEDEANRFAANFLIPSADYQKIARRRTISKEDIRVFAEEIGISPGIVVGRLQHDGRLAYSYCNELKRRFEWA